MTKPKKQRKRRRPWLEQAVEDFLEDLTMMRAKWQRDKDDQRAGRTSG